MTKETQTVWKDRKGETILRQSSKNESGVIRVECCGLTVEKAEDLRDALTDFMNEQYVAGYAQERAT